MDKAPLTFEQWSDKYTGNDISDLDREMFNQMHSVNLDDEVKKIQRQEYDLYLERHNLNLPYGEV